MDFSLYFLDMFEQQEWVPSLVDFLTIICHYFVISESCL